VQVRGALIRCPFDDHDDRDPSFSVFSGHDGRARWRCHGCGRAGDSLDLEAILSRRSLKEVVHAYSR
jgi:hypothetical protein